MNHDRMTIINPTTGEPVYLVDEENRIQDLDPGKRETDQEGENDVKSSRP